MYYLLTVCRRISVEDVKSYHINNKKNLKSTLIYWAQADDVE